MFYHALYCGSMLQAEAPFQHIVECLNVLIVLGSLVFAGVPAGLVLWYEANSVVWWCVLVGVVIGLCMFSLATLCHEPLSEHKIVPRGPFTVRRWCKYAEIACTLLTKGKWKPKIEFMFNIIIMY